MKTNLFKGFRTFLFLPLFILVMFTSCQNEETDITDTNTEQTFDANSTLAQYMLYTTTNDGFNSTNEIITIEDFDAGLGLYSNGGGNYSSSINMGEIVSGALNNKWSIYRTTKIRRDRK